MAWARRAASDLRRTGARPCFGRRAGPESRRPGARGGAWAGRAGPGSRPPRRLNRRDRPRSVDARASRHFGRYVRPKSGDARASRHFGRYVRPRSGDARASRHFGRYVRPRSGDARASRHFGRTADEAPRLTTTAILPHRRVAAKSSVTSIVRGSRMPTWPEVEASFSPDGALRDIYVHGTDLADWERLLETVRTAGPTRWTVDGIDAPPMTARACFLLRERASVQLDLHFGGILLCTHFFVPDEIESTSIRATCARRPGPRSCRSCGCSPPRPASGRQSLRRTFRRRSSPAARWAGLCAPGESQCASGRGRTNQPAGEHPGRALRYERSGPARAVGTRHHTPGSMTHAELIQHPPLYVVSALLRTTSGTWR